MNKLIASIVILGLYVPLSAQSPSAGPASVQRDEMKKVEFLIGQWRGEGWFEPSPGQRRTAAVTETVQSKLGGLVLLIEGVGRSKLPGKNEESVVHHALAMLSYDEKARRYRFAAHTFEGRFADAEATLIEGGLQWGLQFPGGVAVRYTIKMTNKGEWHEISERTLDGKTWKQFHEMTLHRD